MNNKIKYIFLLAGLIFFVYLVADFGVDNIIRNLEKTSWYFLLIISTWIPVYLFNAVAWNFIINRKELPFHKVLSVTIRGYALNYMTPFFHLGGEPYKVLVLKNSIGLNRSLSVTVSYLMLHFLSSFLFWIAAIIAIYFFLPVSTVAYVILTVCLVVFTGIVFLFMKGYKRGVTKSFALFFVKLPILKKFSERVNNKEDFLTGVDENISELVGTRKKSFIAANIFELASRFVGTLEFYFILKAIGYSPTLLDTFLINAGAAIISNLLFIVPFELGVKEGGLYLTLGLLNYVPAIGIYIGLVNRMRELFWILIGLILIAVSKDKINKEEYQGVLDDGNSTI
jgi:hypothetical protein